MSEGKTSELRLYILILLMILMWAANAIFGKLALRELPALLVVSLRMQISGLVMVPVYVRYVRNNGSAGWTRTDLPVLLALGVLGIGLNQALFVTGLSRTSVAHAALIIGLTPVLVIIMATIAGMERFNRARLTGMAVALGGVALLQLDPAKSRSAGFHGDLVVFAGSIAFAAFTVAGKAVTRRFGAVVVNTFAYIGTGLALIPVTAWFLSRFDYGHVSPSAWASVTYMALFPSVIAYLIYYYALERMPASRVSAFSYLQPLFATAMAIPALGEYPTQSLVAGGALVLCGVFVAERV